MMVDPKYGGSGMDTVLCVSDGRDIKGRRILFGYNVSKQLISMLGFRNFWYRRTKEKYLKDLAKGEIIGAFCLSEPEAGSDATSQQQLPLIKEIIIC